MRLRDCHLLSLCVLDLRSLDGRRRFHELLWRRRPLLLPCVHHLTERSFLLLKEVLSTGIQLLLLIISIASNCRILHEELLFRPFNLTRFVELLEGSWLEVDFVLLCGDGLVR